MTNEQILKKAIEKAEKNGYELPENWIFSDVWWAKYAIIFSHDFCKAFFGEGETPIEHFRIETTDGRVSRVNFRNWELFLREMVLEGDPLRYLEEFL